MRLKGKVALVSGGSRGIGGAISRALIKEGATVIVNYKEKAKEADQIVEEMKGEDGNAVSIKADVSDPEQVRAMIRDILRRFNRIDILVNNAGIIIDSLLFEMEDAEWDLVMNTNLKGVYNCTKAVVRPMMLQGGGKIINISSILAERPWKGVSSYAASKGAVNSFTKAVAVELASKGISVNAVAPGLILTNLSRKMHERFEEKIRDFVPMRRIGNPEEVASLVVYLASDDSTYITGKIFGVDGGLI